MRRQVKDFVARHTLLERAVHRVHVLKLRSTHPEGLVPPVPKRVIVEPTNACNLACAYCGNKDMLRPRKNLSLDLYEKLLDEMVVLGIPRLTLHTIGEPTLHPRIAEMVRMATARGRCVSLSTNGTTLGNEKLARELVEAGPDVLNFSADAADEHTLGITRDGLKPEVLLKSMRNVLRLREECGPVRHSAWGPVRLPTLTVTCVVTQHFTREIEREFFRVFGPLVDDFSFHYANNHADYVPNEPMYRQRMLPKPIRDRLYRALRHTCVYPWDALFLLSDGTMSVCRFDFDARVRIGRYGEQTIPELWHGEAMRSLRRAHMSFDFKDWSQCENCTATYYENRHEHFALSTRLKLRNGFVPARTGWLTENPLGRPQGN